MDVVLTDDEIAAVALARHLAWPVPFATVATDVEHLAAAAARGRRSLLVRGLATPTDAGVDIAADVAGVLEQAVASRNVMAWVASIDNPAVIAGSSIVIYRSPAGDLIDLTSAIGIHSFRSVRPADWEAIVVATAKNVFDFGFFGPDDSSTRLLVGRFGEASLLLVSVGKVEAATWGSAGLEVRSESTDWSPLLIGRALL